MVYDVLNINIITDFVYTFTHLGEGNIQNFLNIDEILYFHWWRKEQLSKLKCNLSNFRLGMIYHII